MRYHAIARRDGGTLPCNTATFCPGESACCEGLHTVFHIRACDMSTSRPRVQMPAFGDPGCLSCPPSRAWCWSRERGEHRKRAARAQQEPLHDHDAGWDGSARAASLGGRTDAAPLTGPSTTRSACQPKLEGQSCCNKAREGYSITCSDAAHPSKSASPLC